MADRVFSPLKAKGKWNPENFCTVLLEKEIELEKSFGLPVIEDLINLYTEAIEHYNEQNDPKFYDFHHKLQTLLMKPEVKKILNGKNLKNFYAFNKRKSSLLQFSAKTKVLENSKKFFTPIKVDEEKTVGFKSSIKESITKQDSSLKDRVLVRKFTKLNFNGNKAPENSSLSQNTSPPLPTRPDYNEKLKSITFLYLSKIQSASESQKQPLAEEMKQKILNLT